MKLKDFDFRIWDNTKKYFLKANPYIFISKDKNFTVEVGTEVYYKDLGFEDYGTIEKIFKPKEELKYYFIKGYYYVFIDKNSPYFGEIFRHVKTGKDEYGFKNIKNNKFYILSG